MQAAFRTLAGLAQALERRIGKAKMKGRLLGGEEGAGFARGLRTYRGIVHDEGPSAPMHPASAERCGLDRSGHLRQGRKSIHAIATSLFWDRGFGLAAMPRAHFGRGAVRSVGRVPDDREGVVIVLARSAAEIGVESARAEFGGGER